jgi:hypothetical protein
MRATMEHDQVQTLLSDYREGGLLPEQRLSVEQHLQGCTVCQKDLSMIQKALDIAQRIPPAKAPSDFVGRVRQRAHKLGYLKGRRHARQNRFFVMWEATLVVLLATFGALVVLMLSWQRLPIQPQPLEHRKPVLTIVNPLDVQTVTVATWTVGGTVSVKGKLLPPGSPVASEKVVDIFVPRKRWKEYVEILEKSRIGSSLSATPMISNDEMIHIVAIVNSNN